MHAADDSAAADALKQAAFGGAEHLLADLANAGHPDLVVHGVSEGTGASLNDVDGLRSLFLVVELQVLFTKRRSLAVELAAQHPQAALPGAAALATELREHLVEAAPLSLGHVKFLPDKQSLEADTILQAKCFRRVFRTGFELTASRFLVGVTLINPWRQDSGMYLAESDTCAEVREDLWRRGRYRVELATKLPCVRGDVGAVLKELGYDLVDVDQAGQSYRLRADARFTAELEASLDEAETITLLLRTEDLAPAEARQAKESLELIYEEFCSRSADKAQQGG